MANLVKRCNSILWTNLINATNRSSSVSIGQLGLCESRQINSVYHQTQMRSIFTSQTLCYKTKKRRKRYPFFWLQDKYRAFYDENMTPDNEKFFQEFLDKKYTLQDGDSPLKSEPWKVDEKFKDGIQRCGLIGKKLAVFPMWDKNGRRIMTNCLQISDNHVIRYHSPEEYSKIARPVDRKRYAGFGCIVVGSDSRDPRAFTAEYNGLFEECGVMPKRKLTRFIISHEARIEPGTPLLASHFRPGMYVDVYGRTVEWGLQGLRVRFRLKLGRKTHGATKSHNRIGSIGRGRKWCGPLKGRTGPGHHGGERKIVPGLKVWRIDTKYNLLYVQGPGVPGPCGSYVNIMDSRIFNKTISEKNPPPFPTSTVEENDKLEVESYDKDVHLPSDPSIIFEITEEEKRAAALAKRMGKAKTAQKIR